MSFLVLIMVFLTGVTGLIYQVTWQKYLAIYLGSHALSTSLTLTCFFLFLSLGYQVVGRYGHRFNQNKIISYALIEALVGTYAVISPILFQFMYNNWPLYASDSALHFFWSFLFALGMMGVPTFLMGGTIPLLTQGLSSELKDGHKVHAWVYGVNTFGAFCGTLLAGFYLIESFGLAQTLNLTGIINCFVAIFLFVYCKYTPKTFAGFIPSKTFQASSTHYPLLLLAFLSGALSFALESLVIRMAGISIGSSTYTYSIVVSAFIVSIAIGSVLAAKAEDHNGKKWLLGSQLGIVFSLVLLILTVPHWPNFFLLLRMNFSISWNSFWFFWGITLFCLFAILSIPVILMGMTLPLTFQQLKNSGRFLNHSAGQMYAINALGASFGAIGVGYLAFLVFDARVVFYIVVILAALSSTLVITLFFPNKKVFAATPLLVPVIGLIASPIWSDYSFIPSRSFNVRSIPRTPEGYQKFLQSLEAQTDKEILYSDYGPNTYTVVTQDPSGNRSVFVNAKPDANTGGDRFTRTMTALTPLTISRENKNIFIIGLGAGMSTGIAATWPGTKTVRVSEIASGVIDSLPFFEKWNFDLDKNMSKVEIVNDDAYKVLKSDPQTYDLIFSEPSNTWVAGVEKIYTKEFLKIAATKLRPHGIYSQWFPLFSMTQDSFLSILANFKSAFKYVTLWSAGGGTAMTIVASHEPLEIDLEKIKRFSEEKKDIYKSVKKNNALEVLYHQIWPDQAITELATLAKFEHSLYHPTLAFQSGKAHYASMHVNLEKLARKYFPDRVLVKDNEENKKFYSEGGQDLLWQKIPNELSEEFYNEGIKFFNDPAPFIAGKLTLARTRIYGKNFKKFEEKIQESVKANKLKMAQYLYLLDESSKAKPETLENDKTLLHEELFSRYIYLLTMRENPNEKNYLKLIPDECKATKKDSKEEDKPDQKQIRCLKSKIAILQFLDPKRVTEYKKWDKSLVRKTEAVKTAIDSRMNEVANARLNSTVQ